MVYYSGSGSHANKDTKQPGKSTNCTIALNTSIKTGEHLRVLRSALAKDYAPAVGIRYDGLYKVVSIRHPLNPNGGMYEQFKLQRCGGQPSLSIVNSSPTAQQIKDFEQIKK